MSTLASAAPCRKPRIRPLAHLLAILAQERIDRLAEELARDNADHAEVVAYLRQHGEVGR